MKAALTTLLIAALFIPTACSSSESSESGVISEGGINWITDVKTAQATAATEGKPIFAFFTGSDWCGWCKRLEAQVFSHKEFQDYARENLVMLMLDFPRRSAQAPAQRRANESMAKQYGVRGFPTIVLTGENGREIGRTGFQQMNPAQYVEHLKKLLSAG